MREELEPPFYNCIEYYREVNKVKEIVELVRSLIRPYIAITGWTAFLIIVCLVVKDFVDAEMAKQFAYVFVGSITTIVGVWIGGRAVKPKE